MSGFPSGVFPQIEVPPVSPQVNLGQAAGTNLLPLILSGIAGFAFPGADAFPGAIIDFFDKERSFQALQEANSRNVERTNAAMRHLQGLVGPGGPINMGTLRETAPAFNRPDYVSPLGLRGHGRP